MDKLDIQVSMIAKKCGSTVKELDVVNFESNAFRSDRKRPGSYRVNSITSLVCSVNELGCVNADKDSGR